MVYMLMLVITSIRFLGRVSTSINPTWLGGKERAQGGGKEGKERRRKGGRERKRRRRERKRGGRRRDLCIEQRC